MKQEEKKKAPAKKDENKTSIYLEKLPIGDTSNVTDLGSGIHWIGADVEEVFHCNPYLIVDGEEAVLVDPGGLKYVEAVLERVKSLVDLKSIKYIVAHHQDPDVCSGLNILKPLVADDCLVVCHSRMSVLLEHFGSGFKYYEVDKEDWSLRFGKRRVLSFAHTPYLHSPGAIVTYDKKSQTVFTSDLFGAVDSDWSLHRKDKDFSGIHAFHTGYMPSIEILKNGLEAMQSLGPIKRIAPQHGSILEGDVLEAAIESLDSLEVGMYADVAFEKQLADRLHALRMKQLVANASIPFMMADENGIIIYINDATTKFFSKLEHLLPCKVSEIVGKNFDFFHKNPAHQRGMLSDPKKYFPRTTEMNLGEYRLRVSAFGIFDEDDNFVGPAVTWEDATAEAEVKKHINYLYQVPGPVMAIDPDFNVKFMNTAGAELLNKTPEELIGKKCYDLFKTGHCHTKSCRPHMAMQTGQRQTGETVANLDSGPCSIRYTGSPVYDADGNLEGALEFIVPINDEKEIQAGVSSGAETLSIVVGDVKDLSSNLDNRSAAITSQTSNVAAAAEELSMTMANIRESADNSQANISNVAAATEEMSATTADIAQNAQNARQMAENAVNIVREASNKVDSLGSAAGEIDQVIETIVEISDQTKLLALNATIEAARAGEAGKGFAVVASEVKDLAKETNTATGDIRKRISAIQASSKATIEEIQRISSVIAEVSEFVLSIATATEEQSKTAREMAESIADASQGVQEMASSVGEAAEVSREVTANINEAASAVKEIDSISTKLSGNLQTLDDAGKHLKEMIARFDKTD